MSEEKRPELELIVNAEQFLDNLPPNLQEIVGLLGLEKTLILMQSYGGRELYVPLQFPPEHEVCISLGNEAAQTLAQTYGGGFVLIPKGVNFLRRLRNQRLWEDRRTMTVNELAVKYGLGVRSVWKILEQLSQNQSRYQQQELLEDL